MALHMITEDVFMIFRLNGVTGFLNNRQFEAEELVILRYENCFEYNVWRPLALKKMTDTECKYLADVFARDEKKFTLVKNKFNSSLSVFSQKQLVVPKKSFLVANYKFWPINDQYLLSDIPTDDCNCFKYIYADSNELANDVIDRIAYEFETNNESADLIYENWRGDDF